MDINSLKHKWGILALLSLFFGFAFLFLASSFLQGGSIYAQAEPSPTAEIDLPQEVETEHIRELELILQDEALDPVLRASLEEKLSLAQNLQEARVGAISAELADISKIEPPKDLGGPAFQPGIFEGGEGLFRPQEAVIENYWQDHIGDRYVQVFAGATGNDPDQGVVYIVTTTQDRVQSEIAKFLTPAQIGSVRIIAETNLVLHLENQAGEVLLFDIESGQFDE